RSRGADSSRRSWSEGRGKVVVVGTLCCHGEQALMLHSQTQGLRPRTPGIPANTSASILLAAPLRKTPDHKLDGASAGGRARVHADSPNTAALTRNGSGVFRRGAAGMD